MYDDEGGKQKEFITEEKETNKKQANKQRRNKS